MTYYIPIKIVNALRCKYKIVICARFLATIFLIKTVLFHTNYSCLHRILKQEFFKRRPGLDFSSEAIPIFVEISEVQLYVYYV